MNKKLQQQHTSYTTILFINFTIYFDRFFSLFENKKKKKKTLDNENLQLSDYKSEYIILDGLSPDTLTS